MPALQEAAGLGDVRVSLAGQTGLADETVQESLDNVLVLSVGARCWSTSSSSSCSCAR